MSDDPAAGRAATRPKAAVLVTGSELLTGLVRDANGPYLARELGGLGFEVSELMLVGDRPEDLRSALEFVSGNGAELVITSGGLGPTADDLTAEVVAGVCGVGSRLDPEVRETINTKIARWASRSGFDGPALEEATRKQAGDASKELVKGLAIKRMGTPQDMVGACLFLLSDEASWVTGQIVNVDGGQVFR